MKKRRLIILSLLVLLLAAPLIDRPFNHGFIGAPHHGESKMIMACDYGRKFT